MKAVELKKAKCCVTCKYRGEPGSFDDFEHIGRLQCRKHNIWPCVWMYCDDYGPDTTVDDPE